MYYIVNKPIRVEYQPAGGTAGLTVGMEILDETGDKDIVNYPDVLFDEIPLVGGSMYRKELIPDTIGTWTVHIADSLGGTAIRQYVVVRDIEHILTAPAMVA